MPFLPPIPAWNASHPIVVHFPIALLLIAPLAVLAAIVLARHRVVLTWVSAGMVVLGAGFAVLATASGDAGEDAAPAAAKAVLERHEEMAELARNLFLGLAGVLTAGAAVQSVASRRAPVAVGGVAGSLAVFGLVLYLVLHLGASAVLANAAHEGGRLVHEFGTRALAPGAGGAGGGGDHDD